MRTLFATGSVCFITVSDSPVKAPSSVRTVVVLRRRMRTSAGTCVEWRGRERARKGRRAAASHAGRHLVADADLDDVAGDELLGGEVGHELAAADALRRRRLHLLERLERRLGVVLLPHADDGVDHEDEQDDEGLDEGLDALALLEAREHEREHRRAEQDLDEQVVELREHELPQRRRLLLRELVLPVLGGEPRHLRRAQPRLLGHAVRLEHLRRRLGPLGHRAKRGRKELDVGESEVGHVKRSISR